MLLPQHNLDFIMFRIQLPIFHKFNQNVIVRCFILNLKQVYQSDFIWVGFLFLSRVSPKQIVLQIAIITLFCWSKDIINLIILMNTHFLPTQIYNHCLLTCFFLCAPCWEYELSLKCIIEYAPLDVIVIVVVATRKCVLVHYGFH